MKKPFWKRVPNWVFPVVAVAALLFWALVKKRRTAAETVASNVAKGELGKLKGAEAEEARAARKEGDAHKAMGEAAVGHIKALEKEARERGNEDLAKFISDWY